MAAKHVPMALLLVATSLLALCIPAPCAAQQMWGKAPAGVTVCGLGGGTVRGLGVVTARWALFGAGVLLFPGPSEGQQQLGLVRKFETLEDSLLGPVKAGGGASTASLVHLHSHIQECPKGKGLIATEGCRMARAVLNFVFSKAEEQHLLNSATRDAKIKSLPAKDHYQPMQRFKENIMVPTWSCPLEGRFGLWGEGGKWVCLVHAGAIQEPVTVSIGSKGDTSFERDMYTRLNASIHTFDPTLNKGQQQQVQAIPYLTFHDAGLSGKASIRATLAKFPRQFRNAVLLTVPQLIESLDTSYVDIFKIDCEGCEYGVVDDMVALYTRDTVPFGQILMEIHYISRQYTAACALVAKLEGLGYRMFHAEENAFYYNGYEMAFIHESLTRF